MKSLEQQIQWLLQEKYHGKDNVEFKKDVQRLKTGEPLDYVIGFVEFLGCKILVDKNVLIPRFETEFWVEKAIEEVCKVRKVNKVCKVLDIFAGSGCIGISIMRHIKNVQVIFVDSEKPALKQIEKSIKANQLFHYSYELVNSDVLENVKGTFDYIFANPPYIPMKIQNSKFKIQNSVLKYEPHAALFGGRDGLLYIRQFLAAAKNRLAENGTIFMEFDPSQKLAIAQLLKQYGYASWQFNKDQYGKWRWVVVK